MRILQVDNWQWHRYGALRVSTSRKLARRAHSQRAIAVPLPVVDLKDAHDFSLTDCARRNAVGIYCSTPSFSFVAISLAGIPNQLCNTAALSSPIARTRSYWSQGVLEK